MSQARFCGYGLFLLIFFLRSGCILANQVDSLLRVLDQAQDPEKTVAVLLELSDQYYYRESALSMDYARRAMVIVQEPGFSNDSLRIDVDVMLADNYSIINDTAKAFFHFRQGLKLAERISCQSCISDIYGNMGIAYGNAMIFDKSLESYQRSLQLDEELKDTLGIAANLNNIGTIYLDLEEYDLARPYFEKQCELSKLINDLHGCAIGRSNLGDYFVGKKQYEQALQHYRFALNLVDSLGLNYGVMISHLHIAEVYYELGLVEEALNYCLKGYEMVQKHGYPSELAIAELHLAKIKAKQGYFREAIEFGTKALQSAHAFSSIKKVAEVYQNLAESFEAVGEYEKALDYRKRYENAKDSLFVINKLKNFAQMRYEFQSEQKEAENHFLKEQQLKNEAIIRSKNLLSFSTGIALALLVVILAMLFWLYRNKIQSFVQLESKVRERTAHLTQSNQKLQKANQELERFAHIVSHDLKEPLRNICSFAGLTLRAVERQNLERTKEYSNFIFNNARQMNGLVEDILDFSRVDNELDNPETAPLSVIFERARSDIHTLIYEKNARIVQDFPGLESPQPDICLPVQFSMVFKNLMENGIKYNRKKVPVVKVALDRREDHFLFSVKDNGIGISEEYQETVFEMFKRLHSRDQYEGSGIGLAICKKVVTNFGGQISFKSHLGEGTTFEFSLPKVHHQNSINA